MVEIKNQIYWVGYVDWSVRDFHGYKTESGSTYNSYLVKDNDIALIDTVKAPYVAELIKNVSEITDVSKVRYVVCNHAEPDHSGGLVEIMKVMPQAELICNSKCRDALSRHYNVEGWKFRIVSDGESVSLGRRSLTFIDTPMAHWPESMFTYVKEEKLLFSMDAFGQHYASAGRFDDQQDMAKVMTEARKYYANIIMPYGRNVARVLEKAAAIDIEIIAPSHGVIWRKDLAAIIGAYKDWVVCRPLKKVLIIYDTMWGSTEKLARAIAEGSASTGAEVRVLSVRANHITDVATEAIDCAVMAIGSATLNMTLMPEMASALTYLKGLRPVNKTAAVFGSYGWGKGACKDILIYLADMKCAVIGDPLEVQYVPDKEKLAEAYALGVKIGRKALEIGSK